VAGTLIVIIGYRGGKVFRPERMKEETTVASRAYEGGTLISTENRSAGNIETPVGDISPFRENAGKAGPDQGENQPQ
jgi:hypothetical protein